MLAEDLSAGINKSNPSGKQFSLKSRDGNENKDKQRFNSSSGSPSLLEVQIMSEAAHLGQIMHLLTNSELQIINNAEHSSQKTHSSSRDNSKQMSSSLSGIPSLLEVQIMSEAAHLGQIIHLPPNPELEIMKNAGRSSQKTRSSSMDNSKQMFSSLPRTQKNSSRR